MPNPKTKTQKASKEVVESYIAEADSLYADVETNIKKEIIASFAAAALPALITAHYPEQGWRAKAAQEAFEVGNAMYVEFEKQ